MMAGPKMQTSSSHATLYMFMGLMLVTGALNAIMLKFQHKITAPMSPGAKPSHFDQPFLQASFMMLGEFCCMVMYLWTRNPEEADAAKAVPGWIFIIPCCCDWLATAFVCMSLGFIAVSVMQMCRGSVVIFTCLLSQVILGRSQQKFHLFGVACVICGISLVSYSALGTSAKSHASVGIFCCIFAQIFQAFMYVYEEKIMSRYKVQPLQLVGWEGLWGLGVAAVVLPILYSLGLADTPGAIYQMQSSNILVISMVLGVLCVALFNFSGANVTQRSSAVARSTIKISSTILIWIVELAMGWNTFSFAQLVGFILVAVGTLVYNRIIILPAFETDESMPIVNKA
mmetsp:Transcript_9611/g.18249  ORF Transcript_9611/g.18249 Transcript_9611/m.18249 type:complete len:342 (-) Transcript_9611:25-1050(-)